MSFSFNRSMKKIIFILYSVFQLYALSAQSADSVEVELKTGDTVAIGQCEGATFKHLDMYRKTRWEGNEPTYDSASGSGFFASFFASGDFDVAELPKAYSNKLFTIIGVEVLMNKNTGKPMNVMYLKADFPNAVIWVDFDEAFESGELKLPQTD